MTIAIIAFAYNLNAVHLAMREREAGTASHEPLSWNDVEITSCWWNTLYYKHRTGGTLTTWIAQTWNRTLQIVVGFASVSSDAGGNLAAEESLNAGESFCSAWAANDSLLTMLTKRKTSNTDEYFAALMSRRVTATPIPTNWCWPRWLKQYHEQYYITIARQRRESARE